MARLDASRAAIDGERGAVYVEFLIAFIPLFVLVLGICQLAFIASAKAVVEHAAWAAVRSAVVVLEDDPERYGGIPRGDHRSQTGKFVPGIAEVMAVLNIDTGDLGQAAQLAGTSALGFGRGKASTQNWITKDAGQVVAAAQLEFPSRMTTIRSAAYLPLLPLANTELTNQNDSVRTAIHDQFFFRMQAALAYTRAATAITLHNLGEDAVASAPFAPNAVVTARVVYLYSCDVPVVRQFMCRSFAAIQTKDNRVAVRALEKAEDAAGRSGLLPARGRYTLLVGKSTLVNQGAGYEERK